VILEVAQGTGKSKAFLATLVAAIALASSAVSAARDTRLLVISSGDLPQYEAPIAAFIAGTTSKVEVIDVGESEAQGRRRVAAASQNGTFDGIFAVGAQAAWLAREELPDIPLTFAMVIDWQRYGLAGAGSGVRVDMPPDALLTRVKLLLPNITRLGIIVSDSTSAATIDEARRAAADLDISLLVTRIAHSEDVPGAYRRMRTDIDALWMTADPLVVTRDNFRYLATRTKSDRIAFLAFSENFVRAGALLSVSPDYATMGAQAAALLARQVGSDRPEATIQPPIGSSLVVNADTARALGIDLNATILSFADKVIEDGD
jgi:putative ABC transport system substrate-binding protein